MRKDYMRVYYDVLKRIENIILTCEIPEGVLKRILPYVEKFTLDIHKSYTNYEYLLNMSNLMYIYKELLKYKKIKDNYNSEDEDILSLEDEIFKTKESITKNHNLKYKIWIEIVTCVTIMGTLIGIPINFFKDDESTKRMYQTTSSTYTLVEDLSSPLASLNLKEEGSNRKSDDTLLYEFYKDNDGVIRTSSKYEEILPYISNLIVKKYYPWQVTGDNASREVVTYEITDENMTNLFDARVISRILADNDEYDLREIIYNMCNLDEVLSNSKSTSSFETQKVGAVDRVLLAYNEPYYEFTMLNQNLNDYIDTKEYHSLVDYLLLAIEEILVYAVGVTIFDETLLITYFKKIIALASCYKLNSDEVRKLRSLLRKYHKITSDKDKETGIVKKRLLI